MSVHGIPTTETTRAADSRRRAIIAVVAAAVTLALTWGMVRGAWAQLMVVVVVTAVAVVVIARGRLARLQLDAVLTVLAAALPALALLGPTLAAPAARSVFFFRLAVGALLVIGIGRVALAPARLTLGPRGLRTPLLLWYAWMVITLLWAPDKLAGLDYLLTVGTMLVLTFATAACGARPRALRLALWSLGAVLAVTLLVAAAELATDWHLPGSSAIVSGGQKATAWFVNTNDLATYLAVCWPFLLLGAMVARRTSLRALAVLLLLGSAAIVLFTGSRTGLVTIGLETLVAGLVAFRLKWLSHRSAAIAGTVLVVVLAGVGALALNDTDVPLLRQFRLAAVAEDVQTGSGSGDVRVDLARGGLSAVTRFYFAGVGPGNAEDLTKQSEEVGVAFGNLHSWWFEVFVNSGVPGFILFVIFYGGLIVVTGRAARRAPPERPGWLAAACFTALIGFIVGAFGPSTSVSFAPLWILLGLGLAVAVQARRRQEQVP